MKLACLFILASVFATNAATLYCSPAGGGSGADFNNLATLPNTTGFTRGNIYIIVDGSYGSKTLSTVASGTSTITIKKASAADSGVAGYATTLHDGVATFGTITVATQYWIVDGMTRTESFTWTAPTGYGFSASSIFASSGDSHDADNSQFRYIDIGSAYDENPSAAVITNYSECIYLVYNQTDITFTRCAIHNYKGTGLQGAGSDNLTFEYCDIGPGWGKEALRGGNGSISSGWIIRYNRFYQSSQTDPNDPTSGITAEIGIWSWTGTATGHAIYGNVFYNNKTGGRNAVIAVGGDNSGWPGDGADGTVCYNNTFAGMPEDGAFGMIDLNGASTIVRNTLFWDTLGVGIGATTTSDNDDAVSDPFVSYSTKDFRLSGPTGPGFTLSTPYNTDPSGNTRGTDGTWDVGAYEFVDGTGNPPASSAPVARGFRGMRVPAR